MESAASGMEGQGHLGGEERLLVVDPLRCEPLGSDVPLQSFPKTIT